MAADFGLVANPAKRHAHIFAPGGARDRLAKRGLADSRRADKAQDRSLDRLCALLHGKKFDDAVLDLLQPVMVGVENFASLDDVFLQPAGFLPRHGENPVEIVADDGRLGAHRAHVLELAQLGIRLFAGGLRHLRLFKLGLELFQLAPSVFAVAELLLDGLHLLVQIILALRLLHLPLDAVADTLFHLQRADLLFHQLEDALKPLMDVEMLQKLLFFLDFDSQMRGDHVGDLVGLGDLLDGAEDFRCDLLVELDILVELLHSGACQAFGVSTEIAILLENFRIDSKKTVIRVQRLRVDHHALAAFDKHLHGAVRQFQQLQDRSDRTDGVQAVSVRILGIGFLLGHQDDLLVLGHHGLQRADRLLAADKQRHDHVREYDNIAKRQDREGDHRSV